MEKLRLSGVLAESIVDGPGFRFVVFAQGCPHRCPGCHNPGTHDPCGGYEAECAALALELRRAVEANPLLSGITLSGGEPFLQARPFAAFAEAARAMGLDVWTYTGYVLEDILSWRDEAACRLLKASNTLVDGPYIAERGTYEASFRGSDNQRIITAPGSYCELQ